MALSMLKDGKIIPLEEERDDVSPHTEPEGEGQPQDAADADILEEAEGFSGKEKAANKPGTEKRETGTGFADAAKAGAKVRLPVVRRDWVEEAWKCFIKDAGDIDPTDPVKAVETYFHKNATDELKARCKAEGKDARGCWKFIEAVARKALGGRGGHIDPAVVYAIAMHWFEDVPKDWDKPAPSPKAKPAKPAKSAKPKKPAETPSEIKKEKAKAKAKRKPKQSQGFFFEMLETPEDGGENAAAQDTTTESEVKE